MGTEKGETNVRLGEHRPHHTKFDAVGHLDGEIGEKLPVKRFPKNISYKW